MGVGQLSSDVLKGKGMDQYWTMKHNQLVRIFDENGSCPFSGPSDILEWLYNNATTVERRDVFLSQPWAAIHAEIARKQGWALVRGQVRLFKNPVDREGAAAALNTYIQAGDLVAQRALREVTIHRLLGED